MAHAGEIVQRFFGAMHEGDAQTARQILRDDLSFKGPFDTFNKADDYMHALQALGAIVKGVELHKMFVDGQDVCVIYDLLTNSPAGTAPIAEWHHVEGDKIASIQVFFDARPFAAMMGR
jgi:hypothetical protein